MLILLAPPQYLLFAATPQGGFHKPENTPTRIAASAIMGPTGCDNHTTLLLELPGGRTASLVCSIQTPLPNEVLIIGESGTLTIPKPFHAPNGASLKLAVCEREPGKVRTYDLAADPAHAQHAGGFNFGGSEGFVHEIAAVEAAVAAGKRCCDEVPLAESLAVMRIMDEARKQIGLRYPNE